VSVEWLVWFPSGSQRRHCCREITPSPTELNPAPQTVTIPDIPPAGTDGVGADVGALVAFGVWR